MKVTLEGIKAKIRGEAYLVLPDGRTTLCILNLENGFTVNGLSACIDPTEFNLSMGRKVAFEDAFKQIWALEGYLLAEEMHNASLVKKEVDDSFNKHKNNIVTIKKKPHWTQTPEGRILMAKRRRRGKSK